MNQYSEPVLAIYRFMTDIVTSSSSTETWETSYKEAHNAEVKRINYENDLKQANIVLRFSE